MMSRMKKDAERVKALSFERVLACRGARLQWCSATWTSGSHILWIVMPPSGYVTDAQGSTDCSKRSVQLTSSLCFGHL